MDRHIVIAGQPRSGTTLFYSMLRGTLQGFEMPPNEAPAASYLHRPGNFLTKRPLDIFDIPKNVMACQGRKRVDLIVSMRDPRDILTSRHKSIPNDYFVGADYHWFVPAGQTPRFISPGLIPIHNASIQVANSGLFPQGVFFLKYEDLVDNPERIQTMLAEGLGLTFDGKFSDFHKQEIPTDLQGPLNGVRPVEKRAEAKWKKPEHHARIIDQFTRFPDLHKLVIGLGYEKDERWLDELRDQGSRQV
jgi:hypothetical protein